MRWKERKGPEGFRVITLRPTPVLKDITFDVFERGCRAMGIDADALLGGEVEVKAIQPPPISRAREFLDAVLENGDKYDLGAMRVEYVQAMLEVVAAHFFIESLESLARRNVIATV